MDSKLEAEMLLIEARRMEKRAKQMRQAAYSIYPHCKLGGRPRKVVA